MKPLVKLVPAETVTALRARYREETNAQIVHDAIHRRPGWTMTYLLELGGQSVGFAEVAIEGPWKGKPTVFELYVLPEHRTRAFGLFEAFLAASGAKFFEAQTNCGLLGIMAHAFGRDITSEKIVFRDGLTTALPANGAVLRPLTSREDIRAAIGWRQGGGEWQVELDGVVVGKGGILFHYNRPYGDVWMDVVLEHRRRGLGAWLVQELKRECYELGAVPAARCNPDNVASRQTLQKAGFVPCAHILIGAVA